MNKIGEKELVESCMKKYEIGEEPTIEEAMAYHNLHFRSDEIADAALESLEENRRKNYPILTTNNRGYHEIIEFLRRNGFVQRQLKDRIYLVLDGQKIQPGDYENTFTLINVGKKIRKGLEEIASRRKAK